MESYCDLLVVRTKSKDDMKEIADKVKIPIINAGNGSGEHPTQALLDVFTIREKEAQLIS